MKMKEKWRMSPEKSIYLNKMNMFLHGGIPNDFAGRKCLRRVAKHDK